MHPRIGFVGLNGFWHSFFQKFLIRILCTWLLSRWSTLSGSAVIERGPAGVPHVFISPRWFNLPIAGRNDFVGHKKPEWFRSFYKIGQKAFRRMILAWKEDVYERNRQKYIFFFYFSKFAKIHLEMMFCTINRIECNEFVQKQLNSKLWRKSNERIYQRKSINANYSGLGIRD